MNSNYGKSNTKSGSLNNFGFDFDLGLNSGHSRSLNDQKNQPSSSSYTSSSYMQSKPSTTPSWTSQPNKASWTHQPAAASQSGLAGPTSMVGDIFGKSWTSSAPSRTTTNTPASSIGISNKNPNLFGDLVNSALGQNKSNSNVPLKNAGPTVNKTAFSMGDMADSLPKTTNASKGGGNWGSSEVHGSYTSAYNVNNVNLGGNSNKSSGLGGPAMKSMGGSGLSNKDPFGSLVDFGVKPKPGMSSQSTGSNKTSLADDDFGNFQNAPKPSVSTFSSNTFATNNNGSTGFTSTSGGNYSKLDDFGFSNTQSQPKVQASSVNDFDSMFGSSAASSGGAKGVEASGNQEFSGGDDWGFDSGFGGGDDVGGTTELDGLPPPPSGVTASIAKNKGMDSHKQGQYADAIKWLSWAVILLEKSGDDAGAFDVLSCRASCYKEVGEYKKAVADCTKVLEQDASNISVLVQRALLYESMEKYKLGAEDLRTVMKIDPGNRVARSTIHRLTKMAG